MEDEDERERMARLAGMLFEAARTGDSAMLAEATSQGAPANLTNQSGDTLLMLAAYHGHAEAVSVLLAAGSAADTPNDRGQTPLGGVAFKGFVEVARLLVDAGADPLGGTPSAMVMATAFDNEELLTLFDAALARRRSQ